jgi:hypothetical protein
MYFPEPGKEAINMHPLGQNYNAGLNLPLYIRSQSIGK